MLACDLCGAMDPEPVLVSERLDGPLVRCRRCGLHYVGLRERDFTFAATDQARSQALAGRVEELGLVDRDVEDAEAPWRDRANEVRLRRVLRHAPGSRLLDVGCANGSFLRVAEAAGVAAAGIEPDPGSAEYAREAGLDVTAGTLEHSDLPRGAFDAVTMWHVIEHLGSPRAAVTSARGLLAPRGALAIETPAIDTPWFALLRGRWRQLIPDHYFFFSRATLERLLTDSGFRLVEFERVGRSMSLRFAADRVRRAQPQLGALARRAVAAAGVEERTVSVRLGDIMVAVAVRED